MYQQSIRIKDPKKIYYQVLLPETVEKKRFSVTIDYQGTDTIVQVEASDATSLKAITHSFLQIIEMIETTNELTTKHNGNE
jgi:tRNA threonylcarbamoyladenosine modification (KEOPS) complex  Pcc1 subunit